MTSVLLCNSIRAKAVKISEASLTYFINRVSHNIIVVFTVTNPTETLSTKARINSPKITYCLVSVKSALGM